MQLNVIVPLMQEKQEWKCQGQTLKMMMQLTDTVATIKARISEITGMPPGKQKLQCEVCIGFENIILEELFFILWVEKDSQLFYTC